MVVWRSTRWLGIVCRHGAMTLDGSNSLGVMSAAACAFSCSHSQSDVSRCQRLMFALTVRSATRHIRQGIARHSRTLSRRCESGKDWVTDTTTQRSRQGGQPRGCTYFHLVCDGSDRVSQLSSCSAHSRSPAILCLGLSWLLRYAR